MRSLILGLTISITSFAVGAFAIANAQTATPRAPNFESRKAVQIKRIDNRISRLQDVKTCLEAAANQNDLEACRQKFNIGKKPTPQNPRQSG